MCFIQTSIRFIIIVVVLGCIIVGADVVKSNPVNSDSTVSVVSSSSSSSSSSIANRTTKRALLFDQSLTTNVPLVLQSSSSPSPSSSSSSSSSSTKLDFVIEQSFTQTLHILNQSEFNNEELTRYELLMSSYTDNFGYNVSIPYILPSCRVTSQSLASYFGTEESQQVHVLTVAFTMGYYDSQNYDDYDVENYPILFRRYINSHLGVVTKDMRDRWILPVIVAQTVEIVVDDTVAAATTVNVAAPTNSPVVAQVMMKDDTDDATFIVAAGTPTNAPSTRMYSSSSNPFLDTTTSSPSSKPTSTSSHHSTITPSMPSPQYSTTYQLEPNKSLSSTPSSPLPYSLPPKLTYHVQSTMVLDSVSHKMIDSNGDLDPIAKDGWIQVTQNWIRDATVQYIGSDVGNHDEGSSGDDDVVVAVKIWLDQYKILDDDDDATTRNRSGKSSRRMRSVSSPLQQFYMRGRGLVSQTVPPAARLQLEFTSVLSFHSSEENWNANEIVASGFQSVQQQTKYIDALKNQLEWNPNDSSFDSMAMEVNGELITDKANAPTSTTDSMVVSNAAAAAAAEAESETSNGSSIIFGLKNIYLYAIIIAAVCILLSLAVFICRKRVRNVGSKKVSNTTYEIEGENDAALPINEARQKGSRSDDSLVIETPPDTSGISGFFLRSLKDDSEDRITVVAPSGKLGLVVSSSPNKDTMPMIVQIKNKSVLAGKAMVGDLLLSVDEIECRGMTALAVSNLISSRHHQPERVFVLSRGT